MAEQYGQSTAGEAVSEEAPELEIYEEIGKARISGAVYWLTLILGGFGITERRFDDSFVPQ